MKIQTCILNMMEPASFNVELESKLADGWEVLHLTSHVVTASHDVRPSVLINSARYCAVLSKKTINTGPI